MRSPITFILTTLLALCASLAQAQDYELVLAEAVDAGSNGRLPLQVYMRAQGDGFGDAVAWSIPHGLSETVDVSGLQLVDGVIQGPLTATVNGQAIAAAITVRTQDTDILRGQYRDAQRSPSLVRGIEGRMRTALNTAAPSHASLVLEHPDVGPVVWTIEHDGSAVQSVSLRSMNFVNSGFGLLFEPTQTSFINADGIQAAHLGDTYDVHPVAAVSHDLTLNANGLSGTVSLDKNPGDSSTRLHYELDATMIAGQLFGTVIIRDADQNPVGDPQPVAGHIAVPQPALAIPEISPIAAAPAQGGDAFTPPYFEDLSQSAFADRVRAAALWLGQSSYVGAYHSDPIARLVTHTNNKQYDNGSENTYGAVMAHLMVARLSDDADTRETALRAAQRAGYWGQALGKGPYNMLPPYKGLFYTTIGQAWAYLELYQQTGEAEWLTNARRYADGLRDLQVLMADGIIEQVSGRPGGTAIAGTWTYYTPGGGYALGESDSRTNRDRDFEPIQCGQILHFLGRLRVESGVDDYVEVEQAAVNWMIANLDDDWTWYTKPQAAYGAASFLHYLLRYAENPSDAVIDQVLAYIETNHTSWTHDASRMSPGVAIAVARRQGVDDLDASVGLRMALCYLDLYDQRGDAVYLNKAKALINSVLSRQNDFGYLQSGGRIFNDPAAADSAAARYAEDAGHAYTMYNALTVNLLHQCYQALAIIDAFAGGAVVSADLDVDRSSGVAPLTVAFDASASTGSGLSYHWDLGDGSQATGASLSHRYDHPGNYRVVLRVRSGNVVDSRALTIQVREAQELTSVSLSPVEAIYWQNPLDFYDPVDYLKIGEVRPYQATAYDQYGARLAAQPDFTWTTSGDNVVNQDGELRAQLQPGDPFIFQLEASASMDGRSASSERPFRVLGYPDTRYEGFSVNFYDDDPVDHPSYTAGAVPLDQWNNETTASWGSGHSLSATLTDTTGNATLKLSASKTNGRSNSDTAITNTDALISRDKLEIRDDAGLTISEIPQSYRDAGYDLYVYSHRSSDEAHSIRLQIGAGATETIWLKGTSGEWDGRSYTAATATSEAEALSGDFTNMVVRTGLSAETINLNASLGITAIQIVRRIEGKAEQEIAFAAIADRTVDAPPFDLNAISSSGLPVSFTVISGPASIDGNQLTLGGQPGTVVIEANQPGDADYQPAEGKRRSFTVTATGAILRSIHLQRPSGYYWLRLPDQLPADSSNGGTDTFSSLAVDTDARFALSVEPPLGDG